jgi:hypothetical protein
MQNDWEDRDNLKDYSAIPQFESYEDMGEFWDTHSLADYWEQTEHPEFGISEQARKKKCEGWDGEA